MCHDHDWSKPVVMCNLLRPVDSAIAAKSCMWSVYAEKWTCCKITFLGKRRAWLSVGKPFDRAEIFWRNILAIAAFRLGVVRAALPLQLDSRARADLRDGSGAYALSKIHFLLCSI